jgi:hypothetical protein
MPFGASSRTRDALRKIWGKDCTSAPKNDERPEPMEADVKASTNEQHDSSSDATLIFHHALGPPNGGSDLPLLPLMR